MSRELVGSAVSGFFGLTLILSEFRWFQRIGLAERLHVYASGERRSTAGLLSVSSFQEVIAPLSHALGERIARALRVSEELGARLERVHSPIGVTGYRVRQVGWAAAVFGVGVLVSIVANLTAVFAMGLVGGAPLLAFLVLEQRAISASAQWQRRLRMELPVVAEQIAMLTAAGWSLGAALGADQ